MTKVIRSAKVWALGAAMLASVPAGAQQTAVGQQAPPPDRYVVGQATPPVDPGSRLLDMTLDEAGTPAPAMEQIGAPNE